MTVSPVASMTVPEISIFCSESWPLALSFTTSRTVTTDFCALAKTARAASASMTPQSKARRIICISSSYFHLGSNSTKSVWVARRTRNTTCLG
jgi:hypothetical protein